MSRSLKKGPFRYDKIIKKFEEMNAECKKEVIKKL